MHMKELRQEAIKEWASGLLNWQPRRLVLLAPLCISNLLPTTLQLTHVFGAAPNTQAPKQSGTMRDTRMRSHPRSTPTDPALGLQCV